MKQLIKIVEAAGANTKRIDRSAFLYLEAPDNAVQFAQCSSCAAFIPDKERCALFGKNDKVIANGSCGLYAYGEPSNDQEPLNMVSPKDAGYLEAQVRCENCKHLENKICLLFQKLNQDLPDLFKLNDKVEDKACCNAWQAKEN